MDGEELVGLLLPLRDRRCVCASQLRERESYVAYYLELRDVLEKTPSRKGISSSEEETNEERSLLNVIGLQVISFASY